LTDVAKLLVGIDSPVTSKNRWIRSFRNGLAVIGLSGRKIAGFLCFKNSYLAVMGLWKQEIAGSHYLTTVGRDRPVRAKNRRIPSFRN